MSHSRWPRHQDREIATDELLDAAGSAFADLGVGRATMVDVARYAGCSRATLYRYFPNQQALTLAFVHRATLRIAEAMAGTAPTRSKSLADRILAGIEAVRSDPVLAVWFEPENMAVPIAISQESELLRARAAALVSQIPGTPDDHDEIDARGQWLLRSIVSLLAMPGADADAERAMVESFVVPVLVAPSRTATR